MEKINGVTPRNKSRPFQIKENLVDKYFGNWQALKRVEDYIYPSGRMDSQWLCECQCKDKTQKILKGRVLREGRSLSCGCLTKEKIRQKAQQRLDDSLVKTLDSNEIKKKCCCCGKIKSLSEFGKNRRKMDGYSPKCKECSQGKLEKRYSSIKSGAKHRKIKFNITLQDFDEITSKPCFYCDGYTGYFLEKGYTGLDRKDSNIGYELENIVPCCALCNKMKMDTNFFDFIQHIKEIVVYSSRGKKEWKKI